MRSLKGRLERAEREIDAVVIELKDGTRRIFDKMEIAKQTLLAYTDTLYGSTHNSEVFDAVRRATPESRQRFEENYGPLIGQTSYIIASNEPDAWVEARTLREDGTVSTVRYEGGSEEAKKIRLEAQTRTQLPQF